MARITFHDSDGLIARPLWVETITRDHKHRNIYFADAASGDANSMIEIPDDKFLDDNYDISVGDGTIVLSSWSDGHTHLYLYSYNQGDPVGGGTKLERQLTKGDFEVEEISPRRSRGQDCRLLKQ